jgi:hypothetical protein
MEVSGLDDIITLSDRILSFRRAKRSVTRAQHRRAISVLEILPAAAPVSKSARSLRARAKANVEDQAFDSTLGPTIANIAP